MKKTLICFLMAILLVSLLCIPVSAVNASASISGTSTLRAGDTVTLTFNLNGTGILGASGTIDYDSNQLTLTGTSQKVASPWMVEVNGNKFVAYDNNLTNPINKNTALFTMTFKVKSNLAAGTNVKVSCTGVTASDGKADANIGTVTYSVNIAAPLSTDNTLKSLTVSNATISPAFSSSKTSYTASVPYEVSKLNVTAVANDSKAKVTISSPTLTVNGTTKVTVTVKAESGSTKTYTISVKRAQDPNYVPSGNNKLSGIKVDGFLLSPVFNADKDQYVVWLPYETDRVTVSGTAADKKASVKVEGGNNLVAGADNEIKVICTAENGTQKVYTVIAKRAAAHGTEPEPSVPPTTEPEVTEPETEPATEPETVPTEPTEIPTQKPTNPLPPAQPGNTSESPAWLLPLVGLVCLIVGIGAGIIVDKNLLSRF